MRLRGLGVARLVILAFVLQLAVPFLDFSVYSGPLMGGGVDAAIASSLCHDSSGSDSAAPVRGEGTAAKHCMFCLPMVGGHALALAAIGAPLPSVSGVALTVVGDGQVLNGMGLDAARARAPPSAVESA